MFHGNGPCNKIPTKQELIWTLGFISKLPCHIKKCLLFRAGIDFVYGLIFQFTHWLQYGKFFISSWQQIRPNNSFSRRDCQENFDLLYGTVNPACFGSVKSCVPYTTCCTDQCVLPETASSWQCTRYVPGFLMRKETGSLGRRRYMILAVYLWREFGARSTLIIVASFLWKPT